MTAASALALAATFAISVAPQKATAQEVSGPLVPETAEMQIPTAEFVKKSNMRTVRISPNGDKLAYMAAANGREVLVMLDLNNVAAGPKLILAAEEAREAGDRTMTGYRWVGNDHIVMTMISRENIAGQLADFRRLIAYDVNSGELIQQAWDKAGADAGVIQYINHKSGKYLLQRDAVGRANERLGLPEIVEVDVTTGKYSMVQRVNPVIRGWAVDGEGRVRAGFNSNRDNGKIRMLYRGEDEANFKTVYNEADETFTESIPAPEVFIPGTDLAYATSRHEGFTKVYKVDMKSMTMSEPVFETEGFDVQGLITNSSGSKVLGYRVFDGEMKSVYTDDNLKTVKGLLEEVFGTDQVSIIDYTDDMAKVVLYAGGKSRAGGFYIFDTQVGSLNLLNWQRDALKDAPLNPVKAEWYTARDGKKIQAIVTYPRHRIGEKNLPVVVMPHGGPFGVISATNSGEPWNQPLAEAGYVVVQPNYRGSGGYGKAFEQLGREPDGYGMRMQDDLNDILTYYGKKGLIDPNRACIMGWSYGGFAAARGAQRDADVWKCAIAGAGVYDMPLMNKWDARNLGRFSSGFQATSNNPEAISPALNTDGDWAPLLIVTAKRDARIPMEQAETLVRNLEKSGKSEGVDFRYIVQEQGTHNLPYDDVHIQWIEEAEAWLDKYNPAYIASDASKEPAKIKFD